MRERQLSRVVIVVVFLLAAAGLQVLPADAADDFGGLVAAIEAANRSGSGEISLSGDIVLTAALPAITGSLVIEGGGHSISGDDAFRIFDVNGGALTLSNVTLTAGNAGEGAGGAIRMRNGAQLVIENSTLSGHRAKSGGAIVAYGGTVRITDSRFENNCALSATFTSKLQGREQDLHSVDADGCTHIDYERRQIPSELQRDVDGGAIRLLNGARADIERSTFSGNKATYGGAISTASRNVRLSIGGSSFVSNRASESGGAIWAARPGGGRITIDSSSFVENHAERHGGGAIEIRNNTLEITNSTFGKNRAYLHGGALAIYQNSTVTITHATFVDNITRRREAGAIENTGSKVYMRNSIVVSGESGEDCVGVWDQNVGNISPDGTCAERPSDDPRLGELTGAPAYYPLQDRSPAIDYADAEFCLETDQVGTPRPQGGGCDIGAIEARSAIAAEPTPLPPLVCTLAHQIIAANHDRPSSGCPAGSGADTIVLDRDIILFEVLPPVTSHITIAGNGHSISGGEDFRIFDVDGGTLTIQDLILKDGYSSTGEGGAIRLQNNGRAFVRDSSFINNAASSGGAIYIGYEGVANSAVTVENSSFIGNRSWQDGGALHAGAGSIIVKNSSFVGNQAAGYYASGAIHVSNRSTRLNVVNSSFIDNSRGHISLSSGVVATLTHVTILGNHPAFVTSESRVISPGVLYLYNSIVSGGLTATLCDNMRHNVNNLIIDGACSPRLSGDPGLAEAGDSSTHLELLPGSPAINAADARFCPDTDQLGRPRSIVGRCDIGAIEAVPVSQAVADCAVTTTHGLNFRDGPGGKRIGALPERTAVTATARTTRWFEVEHEGVTGWISADYVETEGECELELGRYGPCAWDGHLQLRCYWRCCSFGERRPGLKRRRISTGWSRRFGQRIAAGAGRFR